MSPEQLFETLRELAEEAELPVRQIRGAGGEGEPNASSGVCRVRGETWVVISRADPLEERIRVLARALRSERPDFVESRFLPPAVRDRMD